MTTAEPFRIGLIVNPMAGRGGPLARHGSDDLPYDADASHATERTLAALRPLQAVRRPIHFVTAAGAMGEAVLRQAGFLPETVLPAAMPSDGAETRRLAEAIAATGVDLLLFVGGDGTARDIFSALGDSQCLLGIPAGVKMHSAVFALSPVTAGRLAAACAEQKFPTRLAEIMDADEAERRADRPSARLFGFARVPDLPLLLQAAKGMRPAEGQAGMAALGAAIARTTPPGHLLLIGAGTTMAAVKAAFGIEGSLIGVDALRDGCLVARDADRATIDRLVAEAASASLVTGLIGGQGFLFGRGNQQLGPATLRRLGRVKIRILATRDKLAALPEQSLLLDTGCAETDRALAGYVRVETGPGETIMMPCRAA